MLGDLKMADREDGLFVGGLFDKGFIQSKRLFFWGGNNMIYLLLFLFNDCKKNK